MAKYRKVAMKLSKVQSKVQSEVQSEPTLKYESESVLRIRAEAEQRFSVVDNR